MLDIISLVLCGEENGSGLGTLSVFYWRITVKIKPCVWGPTNMIMSELLMDYAAFFTKAVRCG